MSLASRLIGFLNYMRRYPRLLMIDYRLKEGDLVYSGTGSDPVEIVSINWAIDAAAVRFGPRGSVIVYPLESLSRTPQPKWDPWLKRYVPWGD